MRINPEIFRGYDLRGLVDKDLNPVIVEHLGKVFGTYLKRRQISRAVVGYDCRATSAEYSAAICRGLIWAGIEVIDIGLNMVGTFYWSQYQLDCPGGVFVTASHNPASYNGFKFANGFSETLVSEGIQELRRMAENDDCEIGRQPGTLTRQDVQAAYFADLTGRLDFPRKFKVVIDAACTTAGVVVPDLLRRIGCEVIEHNCQIDPSFPLGTPDPTELVVAHRLRDEILAAKADLGFSYDADGDRIGIVDNAGNIIWNDILVALFAADVLAKHPGDIIMFNTLCSRVVVENITRHGGRPFMWRTGHSFLKKKNQEVGAAFIGELSGHFFFSKDFYNHDDGCYSTLRLLSYLGRSGRRLSELVDELPHYISSPEIKVGTADELKVALIKKIAAVLEQDFPAAEVINDERAGDGVRLEFPDAMFVVRYSQNGPYVTVKFEAKTQARYEELKKYINQLLHRFPEIDWGFGVNVEALS
ncbi:MAG: phosphomannomutase/phosphoglucomutase [Patescibacteria group bacterium]